VFSQPLEDTTMTDSCEGAGPEGAFDWLFTSATEWGRVLMAARELRSSDAELFEAFSARSADDPSIPEGVREVHGLVQLLRALNIDPEALRAAQPDTVQTLEQACLGCTARARCDHALAAGTIAAEHPEFCPNTSRLAAITAA
jgi:hypothetical protein